MTSQKEYTAIGLMSGTSLDGLDIAYCRFLFDRKWNYEILQSETIPYDNEWRKQLQQLQYSAAEVFAEADARFAYYCGAQVNAFLKKYSLPAPDFISSHGQTIFHQPAKGFTYQLGNGAYLHASTGIPVVFDFRSLDVALGGQGAPLVPAGDQLLFSDFEFCLNLGGISNISFDYEGKRIAFDISPVNLVLNELASQLGKEYDAGGQLAAKGKFHSGLFDQLNGLNFYSETGPKSLGKEWMDEFVFPLLKKSGLSIEDQLHTFCHHTAYQIATCIKKYPSKSKSRLLVTGGGALNTFLIKQLEHYLPESVKVHVPDETTLKFKEALIFAFLGVLRVRNENNCLKSVTGASRDNSGGVIYGI